MCVFRNWTAKNDTSVWLEWHIAYILLHTSSRRFLITRPSWNIHLPLQPRGPIGVHSSSSGCQWRRSCCVTELCRDGQVQPLAHLLHAIRSHRGMGPSCTQGRLEVNFEDFYYELFKIEICISTLRSGLNWTFSKEFRQQQLSLPTNAGQWVEPPLATLPAGTWGSGYRL